MGTQGILTGKMSKSDKGVYDTDLEGWVRLLTIFFLGHKNNAYLYKIYNINVMDSPISRSNYY